MPTRGCSLQGKPLIIDEQKDKMVYSIIDPSLQILHACPGHLAKVALPAAMGSCVRLTTRAPLHQG